MKLRGYWNHFVDLSMCLCILVSGFCSDRSSELAHSFVTMLNMVVYYELECPADELVCYLPDEGHSEG